MGLICLLYLMVMAEGKLPCSQNCTLKTCCSKILPMPRAIMKKLWDKFFPSLMPWWWLTKALTKFSKSRTNWKKSLRKSTDTSGKNKAAMNRSVWQVAQPLYVWWQFKQFTLQVWGTQGAWYLQIIKVDCCQLSTNRTCQRRRQGFRRQGDEWKIIELMDCWGCRGRWETSSSRENATFPKRSRWWSATRTLIW